MIQHSTCVLTGIGLLCVGAAGGCRRPAPPARPHVVIYVSVDQQYAEPVLAAFERETGVAVDAVYDAEASKTTGLVNRIAAERRRPRADVFWNNEVAQTIWLKREGLLQPYAPCGAAGTPEHYRDAEHYWTGVGARARVIVYNTQQLSTEEVPRSLHELLEPRWAGKVAMAYPLFGTTRTHVAALFALWGSARAREYFAALLQNRVQFADGNALVRDLVARGVVPIGLTDTDDVHAGLLRGQPISAALPDQDTDGTLVLPTTVAILTGSPHPEAARRLVDFLVSDRVETLLARSEAAYWPLRPGVEAARDCVNLGRIRSLAVDYETIARADEAAAEWLKENVR
jgi:iron(III) transport system substrate-binding protein